VVTTLSYLIEGTYVFRFSITDNMGDVTYDDVVVQVFPLLSSAAAKSSAAMMEAAAGKDINSISVFPNPAEKIIQVRWDADFIGNLRINVIDANGKMIHSLSARKESQVYTSAIDVSSLRQGVYILEIKRDDGKTYSRKFVRK
jgi:hypothetical protein